MRVNNLQNNLLDQMQALEALSKGHGLERREQPERADFAGMVEQAINSVNDTQKQSGNLTKAFELGDPAVDLSEVMIAVQKSRISFQALTEVRNKLLTAYQDIMNMPV